MSRKIGERGEMERSRNLAPSLLTLVGFVLIIVGGTVRMFSFVALIGFCVFAAGGGWQLYRWRKLKKEHEEIIWVI
jgi:hypothetical protein